MPEQLTENRDEILKQKYRERYAKQLTLAEYMANKKKAERKKFNMPTHLKIILATPFLIIFSFGIFFLPYMLYTIATNPMEPQTQDNDKPTKKMIDNIRRR